MTRRTLLILACLPLAGSQGIACASKEAQEPDAPLTRTVTKDNPDGSRTETKLYLPAPTSRSTAAAPLNVAPPPVTTVATGPLPLLYRTVGPTVIRVTDSSGKVLVERLVDGDQFVRVERRGVFAGPEQIFKTPLIGPAYAVQVVTPPENGVTQTRVRPGE